MKKTLFGIAAMTGLLLATSCSNEDFANPAGKAGTIQFNVGIEQSLGTRALNDGTEATDLYWVITNAEGTQVINSGNGEISNLNGMVTQELQPGNYIFAAWAQNPNVPEGVYDLTNLLAVGVDFSKTTNNNTTLDAFCGHAAFEVNGDGKVSVDLRRPFAQVNFGWAQPAEYTTSSVVISGDIANTINIVTGAVSGSVEGNLVLPAGAVLTEDLVVDLNDAQQKFTYLSMNYLLVNGEATIDYQVILDEGAASYDLDNVPVQSNWRTNILGDVTAGEIEFNIVVLPQYEGDNNEYLNTVPVESVFNVTATINEDGTGYNLKAAYLPVNATITEANFVLTPKAQPMLLLGENGVVTIPAKADGGGNLTAEVLYSDLEPNTEYVISVSAVSGDEEPVVSEPGEGDDDVITTPEEEPGVEYPAHLYIMGNIADSDWGSTSPIELENQGDGIYVIENITLNAVESYFAFFSIPMPESGDWNELNDHRYGPETQDQPAVLDPQVNVIVKTAVGNDTSWKIAGGTYNMTADLDNMELTIEFVEALPIPDSSSIWVVAGDTSTINGQSIPNWNLPGTEIQGNDNVFTFELKGDAFKFSTVNTTDWDTFNGSAYATGNTNFSNKVYQNGETLNLVSWGENQYLPWDGEYTITIDLNAKTITAVTNTPQPAVTPLYIRGDMNNWGTSYQMQSTDGVNYTYTNFTCTTSQGFKIADANWGSNNFGTSTPVVPNTPVILQKNSNSPNTYVSENVTNATVKFNSSTYELTIVVE